MSDDIESMINASIADHPDRDVSGEIGETEVTDTTVAEEQPAEVAGQPDVTPDVVADSASDVAQTDLPATIPAKALTEGERILEEAGFKAKKADGRDNWMPHSRLVKVIDNSYRKFAESLTGTPLGEGAVPVDIIKQHVARIPELETQVTTMKQEAATADNVLNIMENDAAKFVQMLLQVHPDYAKYLRTEGEAAAPAQAAPVASAVTDMPQPDLDMGEGRWTYSPEGYKRLREWDTAQIEARVEARINQRYEPIAKRYEADAAIEAEIPKMRARVAESEAKWKGFKENKEEIFAALKTDRTLTLHDAYISVITAKHEAASKAAEAKLKETEARVLAQIKAAPKATSAGTGGKAVTSPSEPETMEDIIRASIRGLKTA